MYGRGGVWRSRGREARDEVLLKEGGPKSKYEKCEKGV